MNGLRVLIAKAPLVMSPKRRVVSLIGVLVLSLVLLAHTAALTLFLWPSGQSFPGVALVFFWLVSLIAVLLLARFAFALSSASPSVAS